jgi:hypothetical protein
VGDATETREMAKRSKGKAKKKAPAKKAKK